MRRMNRLSLLAAGLVLAILLGGCNFRLPEKKPRTPAEDKLSIAVQNDRVGVAREGIEEGANIDEFQASYVNFDGQRLRNPLWIAIEYGALSTAELLIESGANLNHYYGTDGDTYLIRFIKRENYMVFRKFTTLLLENGANPNDPAKDGTTPIEVLFDEPNCTDPQLLEVINLMISKGLIIDKRAITAARSIDGSEVLPVLIQSLVDAGRESGLSAIEEAAILGKSVEVQTLLQDGKQTKKNETEIAKLIAAYCDLTTLKMSIEQASGTLDIDAMFAAACRSGNFDNVKYLFEDKSADIENSNSGSQTPLIYAIQNDHTDVVKYLLDNCAEVQQDTGSWAVDGSGNELCSAVICGDVEMVDLVKARIGRLNADNLANALRSAALYDRLELITYFRDKGYSGNIVDGNGFTILTDVVTYDNVDALQLLIDYGANPDGDGESDSYSPLIVACGDGYIDMARCLLENGASPYFWPLFDSIYMADFDMVKLLVEYGADINAVKEDKECSILGIAVLNSSTIFSFLIEQGGNVDFCDPLTGRSLLATTAKYAYVENARILIEAGADTSIRDKDGKTAYDYAAASEYPEILALFTENGIAA